MMSFKVGILKLQEQKRELAKAALSGDAKNLTKLTLNDIMGQFTLRLTVLHRLADSQFVDVDVKLLSQTGCECRAHGHVVEPSVRAPRRGVRNELIRVDSKIRPSIHRLADSQFVDVDVKLLSQTGCEWTWTLNVSVRRTDAPDRRPDHRRDGGGP
jgi:hypothetical protein